MAEPAPKHPDIEALLEVSSQENFGRSRKQSIEGGICLWCGQSAKEFRDNISRKEYTLSGFCQGCQDKTFLPEED